MDLNFLEFEHPIAELDAKIEELRLVGNDSNINLADEIERLKKKQNKLIKSIFSHLSSWQVVQLARHPQRPHAIDYINNIFTDFDELHGDRMFADDNAIIVGLARLNDIPVVIIGQEKGRSTNEKVKRNFGLPRPEGYRKALRVMKLAERFHLPIITFIDTPGAYPGIDAEKHGQSEAIARNLFVMSTLKTPIICVVTGEGGSGGALAIGVGDRILMLQYSTYSVISPEGCASILWRSAEHAEEAAERLKLTSADARKFDLIDEVVTEPIGAAHRNAKEIYTKLSRCLVANLEQLQTQPIEKLVQARYQRLIQHGIQYREK